MTFLGKGSRGEDRGRGNAPAGRAPIWRSACFHLTVALSFHGDQQANHKQRSGPHSLKVGLAEACGRPPNTAR